MIHSVFSVYDAKADAFLPPFILPRAQMAQRVFGDCVNSRTHQFHSHPEDYTLFHLGNFDDESGRLSPKETPTSMGLGIEYVNEAQSEHTDWIDEATEGRPNGKEIRQQQALEPHILTSPESGNSKK